MIAEKYETSWESEAFWRWWSVVKDEIQSAFSVCRYESNVKSVWLVDLEEFFSLGFVLEARDDRLVRGLAKTHIANDLFISHNCARISKQIIKSVRGFSKRGIKQILWKKPEEQTSRFGNNSFLLIELNISRHQQSPWIYSISLSVLDWTDEQLESNHCSVLWLSFEFMMKIKSILVVSREAWR